MDRTDIDQQLEPPTLSPEQGQLTRFYETLEEEVVKTGNNLRSIYAYIDETSVRTQKQLQDIGALEGCLRGESFEVTLLSQLEHNHSELHPVSNQMLQLRDAALISFWETLSAQTNANHIPYLPHGSLIAPNSPPDSILYSIEESGGRKVVKIRALNEVTTITKRLSRKIEIAENRIAALDQKTDKTMTVIDPVTLEIVTLLVEIADDATLDLFVTEDVSDSNIIDQKKKKQSKTASTQAVFTPCDIVNPGTRFRSRIVITPVSSADLRALTTRELDRKDSETESLRDLCEQAQKTSVAELRR